MSRYLKDVERVNPRDIMYGMVTIVKNTVLYI